MATSKKFAWLVAIALAVSGGWMEFGPPITWEVPGVSWLWQQPVTGAVIVEESADRPKCTEAQIYALMEAPALKVNVVDKDVVGPDRKPPAVLVPYLDAAKDHPLPVLVTKRGSRYTAVPLIDTDGLKGAIK